MLASLSLAPSADAQQQPKTAVADDIFVDHPSMDRNATVMPAADAKPVASIFSERPIGDASVARLPGGGWILTGTTLRSGVRHGVELWTRSEEHTSELQSLMRISYAVFCLKKKKKTVKYL